MAFPTEVASPLLSRWSGIMVAVVPPTSQSVDVEIHHHSTVAGSTAYALLETITARTLSGNTYSYVHKLPVSTERHFYKARCVAPGHAASTYTAEISATPIALPTFSYQNGGEPVLGEIETVRIPAAYFKPDSSLTPYTLAGSRLSPGSAVTSLTAYAPVPLPDGVRLQTIRTRGAIASGSDVFTMRLRYSTDNTSTLLYSKTSTQTGAFTLTSSTITHTVVAGRAYWLDALMDAFSTGSDVKLYWVELDYIRDSYRQR